MACRVEAVACTLLELWHAQSGGHGSYRVGAWGVDLSETPASHLAASI